MSDERLAKRPKNHGKQKATQDDATSSLTKKPEIIRADPEIRKILMHFLGQTKEREEFPQDQSLDSMVKLYEINSECDAETAGLIQEIDNLINIRASSRNIPMLKSQVKKAIRGKNGAELQSQLEDSLNFLRLTFDANKKEAAKKPEGSSSHSSLRF